MIFQNVPQYPGYRGYQLLAALRPSILKSPSDVRLCAVTPYEAALSNCIYLTQFLTDFGQILDYKSYGQA